MVQVIAMSSLPTYLQHSIYIGQLHCRIGLACQAEKAKFVHGLASTHC